MRMALALNHVARSDRGLKRSVNEDSVFAGTRLLAVADGMGGHIGGEVASKAVIAVLARLDEEKPRENFLSQLRDAVLACNTAIADLIKADPNLDGMGTTLTAMLFTGTRFGMVNVGDSRTYAMRSGRMKQITRDDSFVQSLVDEGRITPEEARVHPHRSLVLRAITGQTAFEPTTLIREALEDDRYMLCSDGLSDLVSDQLVAEKLCIPDLEKCADSLIQSALDAGGTDNVTVIVADIFETGSECPS